MWNMHLQRRMLPLLGTCCAITMHSAAQNLPLDAAVRTGKLANGFTYYIRHNTEPKNRVTFYLANKVGSMQEDEDQRGLAHFMEHMSFNGTRHYPKNQLVEYLQKSGVRFGADLNAYTGFTETVYQLPLPGDDTALVRNGLQIMRDWAADATLDAVEIDKERGVVLEEKRLRNGAAQRMQDQTFPMQVNGSRYANRLPIGTEQVLKNFTYATVNRFYKDWYRPNLQALIVVGDIDVNAMERQVKQLFGDLTNPAKERAVITYNIPLTGKNQFKAVTDAEQTSTQINLLIKQPEATLKTKADYRAYIVRTLYNQAMAGRLRELSTKPDPTFIQAEAGMQGFMGGLDAFAISVSPKPGKTAEAFQAVYTEVIRMQQYGLTAGELERAKLNYMTSMENARKEKSKTLSRSYVQEYLQYFLHGTAAPGIDTEYELAKELAGSIMLTEVNAFAASVVKNTNRDILIYAPEKDKTSLPDEAMMNTWINRIGQEKLAQWKEETNNKGLLPTLPVAGKLVSKERIDSIGATMLTLSNGVKVWVKPTTFRNDEILFSAFSEGGTSLYADADFLQATGAGSLIPAGGVGSFTPVELGKMLAGKTVQVQPYIQERYEGLSGGATSKDLETAMQLVYLYFTAPRKDAQLFANAINRSKASLANRYNNPEAVFADTANLVMSNYHYRRQAVSVARLDSIDPDKAYAIYKERFANAADFTFVFTGSIDTTTFIPLIERYLGSLPANTQKESAKDLGIHIPGGQIHKTVSKGKDNKANVRLIYSGAYSYSDINNIRLSALGSILQYRITERIRELEGGAYSPRAGVNYGKLPQSRYAFSILFTCAPGSVVKLVAAAQEEIEKIKRGGVQADDIAKFVAEQERTTETLLQSNQFWAGWIAYCLQNNESLTGIFRHTALLKTLTPEVVTKAAVEYIDEGNCIQLVLKPEE